jgi:hypothetical protein
LTEYQFDSIELHKFWYEDINFKGFVVSHLWWLFGLTVFRNIRVYELSRPNANEVIVQNKYFQPGQTKTELVQGHQIDNAYPAPHMAFI